MNKTRIVKKNVVSSAQFPKVTKELEVLAYYSSQCTWLDFLYVQ
jgi:hypothetical protein